jgi:hypothetical protein
MPTAVWLRQKKIDVTNHAGRDSSQFLVQYMNLFALHGVNKGAFSHHVIAPHHPRSNHHQSETQDNF